MTIRYVYHASAQDDSDATWNSSTISYTTKQAAYDAWVDGDEIYTAHDHTETGTSNLFLTEGTGASTMANRMPDYRVNRTSGNYDKTTGADEQTIERTGTTGDIDFNISGVSYFGQWFSVGDNILMNGADTSMHFKDCYFTLTGVNSTLSVGSATGDNSIKFDGGQIDFTSDGWIAINDGKFEFKNVKLTGTADANGYIQYANNTANITVFDGCDISAISGTLIDASSASNTNLEVYFRNCDFHASVTFHDSGFTNDSQFVYIENSDDGGQLYQNAVYGFRGDVVTDTGVYYSGTNGYSDADGSVPLSMKMTPDTNVDIASPLQSLDMVARINTTGSKTFTVECVENFTTALTKRECWIEVEYLGSASETLFSMADDREFAKASYTDLVAGSGLGDWTAEPAGSRTVKVTATATVNQAGLYRVRLFLAKYEASKVLHYNPAVTVT